MTSTIAPSSRRGPARSLKPHPALALAAYERLRIRLAEDLGTQPSAATEALFLDLLESGSS